MVRFGKVHTLHTLHKGRGFSRVENSYPYPPKTLGVWATLVIHYMVVGHPTDLVSMMDAWNGSGETSVVQLSIIF